MGWAGNTGGGLGLVQEKNAPSHGRNWNFMAWWQSILDKANDVFQKSGVIDDEQLDAIGWGASHQPVKWDPFLKEDQAMSK